MEGNRRNDRQKKRREENFKQRTGLDFASSTKAKSSMVPQYLINASNINDIVNGCTFEK